ncbi:MAG TPA: POT family MFS transporter, partial [Pirellulales bacterium]
FSFYGMKNILYVFMTEYLLSSSGVPEVMSDSDATGWYHTFVFGVYFTPVAGALISDGWLGKYRTILYISLIYCLGHLALSLDDTRVGLAIGLSLIALGSGGIKPCVSANVGDQFGPSNKHLLEKVYSWFYFSINFGSFFATLIIPALLKSWGPKVAFGVPGVLMLVATIVFWLGRNRFVHVPPKGLGFLQEALTPQGLKAMTRLVIIAACVCIFWALYDQHGSSWVAQAKKMDLTMPGRDLLPAFLAERAPEQILPSQIQTANPLLIMILIPIFTYVIYPSINKVFRLTAVLKIVIGFLLTAASFGIVALIERQLQSGVQLHVAWQLIPYVVLTSGEVMVSITGLEYFYSEAPPSLKSVAMSIWLLAVAFGNLLTASVSFLAGDLKGEAYFWFFAGLMSIAAVVFAIIIAAFAYIDRNPLPSD